MMDTREHGNKPVDFMTTRDFLSSLGIISFLPSSK